MSNLSGLFDAVNEQVGDIAQQVGTRPSAFEPRVFAMIESLSRNVVLPIAGIILTFIACYELIEMITQHNNMAQFEPALIMRWIFKTAVSVWFISNTFDIVMAVFDLTQKVVSDSSGIIAGNTRVNEIGLSMLEASLMQMDVGPLFGLFLQSFFIGITMRILSIVIFVIVYGRMLDEWPPRPAVAFPCQQAGTGTDLEQDGIQRYFEHWLLSAKNGSGRLLPAFGFARVAAHGLSPANVQQQSQPV